MIQFFCKPNLITLNFDQNFVNFYFDHEISKFNFGQNTINFNFGQKFINLNSRQRSINLLVEKLIFIKNYSIFNLIKFLIFILTKNLTVLILI